MKFCKYVALSLAGLLFLSGCGQNAAATEADGPPPTPVEVLTAFPTSIRNEMVYAGQINPQNTASVIPRMNGRVLETFFDVGDHVNEGDILFTMDEDHIRDQIRTLNAQLNQAQQGVASAQNQLLNVTGGQFESARLQQQAGITGQRTQMEAAQISIANAQLQLENAEAGIETALIGLDNALLALHNVETNFNNMRILYEAGTVSRRDFEMVELQYNQALAAVDQARLVLEQVEHGRDQASNALAQARLNYDQMGVALLQSEEAYALTVGQISTEQQRAAQIGVAAAQASVETIRVQLDIATDTLNDTTVRAPMSGVVSNRMAEPGELVSAAAPSFILVDSSYVNVDVRVSELIINNIFPHQQAEVFIQTIRDEPFVGTIRNISPTVDQTNTFPVRLEIPNADGRVTPGMFARVHLVREQQDNAIVLPINAVLESNDYQIVFINDNNTARRVVVTTGISNGREIEITSGLNHGDQVIVRGQTFVSDNSPIIVVTIDDEQIGVS